MVGEGCPAEHCRWKEDHAQNPRNSRELDSLNSKEACVDGGLWTKRRRTEVRWERRRAQGLEKESELCKRRALSSENMRTGMNWLLGGLFISNKIAIKPALSMKVSEKLSLTLWHWDLYTLKTSSSFLLVRDPFALWPPAYSSCAISDCTWFYPQGIC